MVRVQNQLFTTDEQNHRLGLALGQWRSKLSLPRLGCWLSQAPPPPLSQISNCLAPWIPLQFLWGNIRLSAPTMLYVCVRGLFLIPLGSLLSLEEIKAQKRPLCMVLYWPGEVAMQSICSNFSYLYRTVCLVFVVQKMLQPHPCVV